MEIIFLLISLVITLAFIYGIGRTLNTHSQLLRAYKTIEFLGVVHFFLGIVLMMVLFMIFLYMLVEVLVVAWREMIQKL